MLLSANDNDANEPDKTTGVDEQNKPEPGNSTGVDAKDTTGVDAEDTTGVDAETPEVEDHPDLEAYVHNLKTELDEEIAVLHSDEANSNHMDAT
jgi:hypothetical protein